MPDDDLTRVHIVTRKPEKYLLIDRETGDQWEIRDGRWMRAQASATYDETGNFTGHDPRCCCGTTTWIT